MRVSATFSYLGDELELEVVLPSHMRVSATKIQEMIGKSN